MEAMDIQTLINYLQDELTTDERTAVEAYLQNNPNGHAELARVRQMLSGLGADDLVAPSPALVNRVQSAFRRQLHRLSERARREATLQFDSWAQPMPSGVRGWPQERQLLFRQGSYALDLQVVKDVDAYTMRGQLLTDSSGLTDILEGIPLNLHDTNSGQERRSLTDQYGRFVFSQLEQGDYVLLVELERYDVVIVLELLSITG